MEGKYIYIMNALHNGASFSIKGDGSLYSHIKEFADETIIKSTKAQCDEAWAGGLKDQYEAELTESIEDQSFTLRDLRKAMVALVDGFEALQSLTNAEGDPLITLPANTVALIDKVNQVRS
jgi:hypothetical protein